MERVVHRRAPKQFERLILIDKLWFFGGYEFHQLLVKDSSHATLNFIDSSTATVINSVDIHRDH